jgi:hypothetical protein
VEGLAIIVLLGIIIYSNSFDCSFHFDDLRQAFLTALLFVSHPLATQSVTYIVQRMASMVAMFYLLSIALYMKARLLNKGNTSKILLFTGSFISAVAAMFTKENAFTLPFAIVLP